MLIATSGFTYSREQAYNEVRVRSGEQLVRLNVRNEVCPCRRRFGVFLGTRVSHCLQMNIPQVLSRWHPIPAESHNSVGLRPMLWMSDGTA